MTGEERTSKKYTIEYYDGSGRKHREPAKTTRKESAEALLRDREQAIWEGRNFPKRRKRRDLTMGELKKLWVEEHAKKKSLRHDRARLGAAVEFFGEHRLLSLITGDNVIEWRKDLDGKGLATATVNRHLAALRGALNYATARGYSHRDPMAGIELERESNARNRICTADEYGKLVANAEDDDMRLFVVIGYWIGMREGEIANVMREQFREGALWLASGATKEDAVKSVPLPAVAMALIKELPARIDGRVFAYSANTYSRKFSALRDLVGIKDLRFHDLRHTAVTNMLEAGVDIFTIQSFTGHKTLHMMKRYSHIRGGQQRAALKKLEAHHAAGKERS